MRQRSRPCCRSTTTRHCATCRARPCARAWRQTAVRSDSGVQIMMTEIQQPGLIVFGAGSLARLADVLTKVGVHRPLVVTDRGLVKSPVFAQLTATLAELKIEYGVYSDTMPDPDMDAVAAGAQAFRSGRYDGFIGFGGGSAMDTAKAVNLWLHSGGDIRQWRVPKA